MLCCDDDGRKGREEPEDLEVESRFLPPLLTPFRKIETATTY